LFRAAGQASNAGGMICHTKFMVRKIAITLDENTVAQIDRWVQEGKYANRSRALQRAVDSMLEREKRSRLARELAKLDPAEEKELAEERMGDEPWPPY
jgi:Arc/MetJ-type ribon-helix-helix transcriptional regulator